MEPHFIRGCLRLAKYSRSSVCIMLIQGKKPDESYKACFEFRPTCMKPHALLPGWCDGLSQWARPNHEESGSLHVRARFLCLVGLEQPQRDEGGLHRLLDDCY